MTPTANVPDCVCDRLTDCHQNDDEDPVPAIETHAPEPETPAERPVPSVTPTVLRAGGIAPGGSLGSRPLSAGSVRSPILPVQRASVRVCVFVYGSCDGCVCVWMHY